MGATPLLALNLVGGPREGLPFEVLGEVLRGGAEVARAAGAFVLGGHSVDDPEPKYGMAAIGEVHPDRIVRNSGAQPGDVLVLTKPLGTGVLTTALKRDLLSQADLAPAVAAMTALNAGAARAMLAMGKSVHAATDVTGFGLLGHLRTLLEASGAAAESSPAGRAGSRGDDAATPDGHHPRIHEAHPRRARCTRAGRPGAAASRTAPARHGIRRRGRAARDRVPRRGTPRQAADDR